MLLKSLLPLSFLFFLFFPQTTLAQTQTPEDDTQSPITVSKNVDYSLPYPGIFPGKPLYFLKDIRDKLLELTTLNPLRKTEFYLLQADKKLSCALYLFDSHNDKVSEKITSSGLSYLEKAINEEEVAKNSPGNLLELSEKIKQSSRKQVEIVSDFYMNSNGETKEKFKNDFNRAQDLEKRASEFSL